LARRKRSPLFVRGKFKSKLEEKFAKELKKIKSHKVEYETRTIPYKVQKNYIPDFVCTDKQGSVFFIEVKGYLRSEDRTKLRAVLECNPGIDLRLLFAVDNKINAKSKMRYSDWCNKYRIRYAVKEIPEEWFE
jgi:predicted nuclease of restriction endonuclease-like RecB superfamily